MKICIPYCVEEIIDSLQKEGYKAYLVGGCIRDLLLNKIPNDFDIATDALPNQIQEVFKNKKTIDVGKQYGTIIIVINKVNIEVTTFRTEGKYTDGRRPDWVSFCSQIEEDLSRRDFTINALAYNEKEGIVDFFNGINDLNKKIIRSVGNPEKRFKEDYLRILRCVRFSCQLNFKIEEKTLDAIKKYGNYINKVSVERITKELFKILTSNNSSKGIKLLQSSGLLKYIIPELIPTVGYNQNNPHHDKDLFNHILCVVQNTPPILHIRLAALFHDIAKPLTFSEDKEGIGHYYGHDKKGAEVAEKILKRFKVSNELTKKVILLIREHMTQHAKFGEKGLRRFIRRVGEQNINDLFILQKADRRCSSKNASIEHILQIKKRVNKILRNNEAYKISDLDINGNDLIKVGFNEGKIIGEMLEYLLDRVIENPKLNEKEKLKKIAQEKYSFN